MENKWIIDSHSYIGKDNTWNLEGLLNESLDRINKLHLSDLELEKIPCKNSKQFFKI